MKPSKVDQMTWQRKGIVEDHKEYIDEQVKLILAGKKIRK